MFILAQVELLFWTPFRVSLDSAAASRVCMMSLPMAICCSSSLFCKEGQWFCRQDTQQPSGGGGRRRRYIYIETTGALYVSERFAGSRSQCASLSVWIKSRAEMTSALKKYASLSSRPLLLNGPP